MKTFFTVKQADDNESYSGRFNISNDYLDITANNYNINKAIDAFIYIFKQKYCYWDNIEDFDLKKEALEKKKKFLYHKEAYERICKGEE